MTVKLIVLITLKYTFIYFLKVIWKYSISASFPYIFVNFLPFLIFYFKDLLPRILLKYMWGYKIVPTTNLPHYHSKYSCE